MSASKRPSTPLLRPWNGDQVPLDACDLSGSGDEESPLLPLCSSSAGSKRVLRGSPTTAPSDGTATPTTVSSIHQVAELFSLRRATSQIPLPISNMTPLDPLDRYLGDLVGVGRCRWDTCCPSQSLFRNVLLGLQMNTVSSR